MEKKKYLWVAIAVIIIVVIALVIAKMSDKTDNSQNQPVNQEVPVNEAEEQAKDNVPNEPSITDTMPLAEEVVITATGKTFSPKTFSGKQGEKVLLTLSATDDERHTFNFIDENLSFILVTFNKEEGNRSLTFPAPAPGTYTFYIDDKGNTGKMVIE